MSAFLNSSRPFLKSKFLLPVLSAAGSAYLYSTIMSSKSSNEPVSYFKGGPEWIDLELKSAKEVSKDTKLFTFAFADSEAKSGLIVASAILAKFVTPKGSNVIRPYTPISDVDQVGTFDVLVKKYEGGKMSSHIHDLKEGDTLSFKGPIVKWKWEPNSYKELTLIAGGTGIAPMYQLIHGVLKNKEDKTKLTLLYGSKTPEDILLKETLDELAKTHPDQFKVTYFVDTAGKGVEGVTEGFITKDVLSKIPGPSDESHVFVCGPPPLYNAISGNKVSATDQGEVSGILGELGYDKSHVFKF
ncbi:hypothetical protein CANARDRAFT_7105 [[Candida] arabinofermentans NRRL YB-2248]|uniref:NADH-cytochrome b5 reductase n=1 Tax=[Candida] arabinofermentans NRRL YB-2248 TaxID=983967 RepID=A0A1E4T1U0_9ASCO|nr:hypothetical protein CANARDRAFT_7105 [[Candida] arabinofermentans NRRL YB-2248]